MLFSAPGLKPRASSLKSAQRESDPAVTSWSWARCGVPDCQRSRAPGGSRTHVAALRVRCPRHWTTSACLSVGPEGLEPSPGGLRVRCAAASTLIPCVFLVFSRRGRNRTFGRVLIRDLLSPLSYAPMSGAEGTPTLACRIKSPVCCRYTTTPKCRPGVCVSAASVPCFCLLVFSGSPERRTQRHAVISRVRATGPRLPSVGMAGVEPACSCSQGTRAAVAPHPVWESERADLNRRSPGPRPGAITRLRYVLLAVARVGVEPASAP